MSDLVLIQLMTGLMADNLARSLAVEGRKPWAFDKFKQHMDSIHSGAYVAFVRLTRPDGSPVAMASPYPADVIAHRLVVGVVKSPIAQTDSPFFDGYPVEFWFDDVRDEALVPPLDLGALGALLNGRIPKLGLTAESLRQVLSNARSSKIGAFVDGEPRKADYFRARASSPVQEASAASPQPTMAAGAGGFLRDAADAFVGSVGSAGLVFGAVNEQLPRALLAATMAKPFVLLTGLSGSGKTQLARSFGQWLGKDEVGPCHMVVPVRADWTTPEPLLGYEDALIPVSASGKRAWSVPPALEFMLRAFRNQKRQYALILDEMNLAHVERYFADVLSGMESGEALLPNLSRDANGCWYPSSNEPQLVPFPRNLVVIGTVNVDETTYQFSPKVLDRSFSLEFRVATEELSGTRTSLGSVEEGADAHREVVHLVATDPDWHVQNPASVQSDIELLLTDLHRQLADIGLEFGHRTYREALRLAAILSASGMSSADEVGDWVTMTKVLPRIHGSRRQLEAPLRHLRERVIGEGPSAAARPLVARKLSRMIESLAANQYVSFAE